ncbi:GNAT family N-acetyltransferase [Sporomusa sp.]|uniref:GNAT family N-acetyltransferase n=1 Tax=Sporomusa sp. TaxID=2078658 RepID=UPI002C35FC7E|nr:GNAT family N-acetyltransferase [Sporomusa sp.]
MHFEGQNCDLYVNERDENLVGFACIYKVEPAEYTGLLWSMQENAMIVHRMAVTPAYRRSGIGTELMIFADEFSLKNSVRYLKTYTTPSIRR